jgi:voltage-gated potassium channel
LEGSVKYLDSIKELLAIYVALVLLGALAYAHLEQASYLNAIWWACVTALTVGYGDLYPATAAGKVVAVLLMHASVLFILPLLIGNVCAVCVKNRNEFTHDEQEEIKALLRQLEHRLNDVADRPASGA